MDHFLVINLSMKTMIRMETVFWSWQAKTVKLPQKQLRNGISLETCLFTAYH